jgi:membrane protein involved in colicin uptake
MKTKADLLAKMASLGSYPEVTDWVQSQGADLSAAEIWARCERIDWLIWLGGRLHPHAIAAFAGRCAARAEGYAADAAASAAAAARASAYYARHAYAAASDADADAASASERSAQLSDLRAMWSEVSK